MGLKLIAIFVYPQIVLLSGSEEPVRIPRLLYCARL
jgi:hypothetical protein